MAGLSPVTATQEQTTALKVLAQGADRAEADRARAPPPLPPPLPLKGWTSARIAQAFGVRQDRVRLWRSDCAPGRGLCPEGAYRAYNPQTALIARFPKPHRRQANGPGRELNALDKSRASPEPAPRSGTASPK